MQNTMSRQTKPLTLQMLNVMNREFWSKEMQLTDERMSDPALLQIANRNILSEIARRVPPYFQKTFESTLADAEIDRSLIHVELSRKGGKAPRKDALQELIGQIVRSNPNISQTELLHLLKREVGQGIIISIDAKSSLVEGDIRSIRFVDDDGRPKKASVYGLKDRLSREKRKLKSS